MIKKDDKKRDDKLRDLLSGKSNAFSWPQEINIWESISPVARIKVVWVGWGWQNAVNRMIQSGLDWVEFIAVNTDAQALFNSLAPIKINIWKVTTLGLWAWADPEIWKKSAEESREEIKDALAWADMVFITCWLGWWTGTWAAPIVAEIAKEIWALTVWVVTKPFSFEWQNRMSKSIDWYEALKEKVDTLITIPNDKILSIIDKKTPLLDAFSVVDEVLNQWVQWVSDLITKPGLINVDFADVRSIMRNAGSALMWIWYWTGENRAIDAAKWAIDSPLLELSIAWAKWLLFNITWGSDLSMFEVDEAAKIITEYVDVDANIIFGASIDENYTWEVKITVVATWFDESSNKSFVDDKATTMLKNNSFWRRTVSETKSNPITPSSQPKKEQDDLDIPTFLRKKMQ